MTPSGPSGCDPIKFIPSFFVTLRSSVSQCRPGRASWPHLGNRPMSDLPIPPPPRALISLPLPPPGSSSARVNGPVASTPAGKAERGAQVPGAPPPPPLYRAQLSPRIPTIPRITRLPGAPEEAEHILEGVMSGSRLPTPVTRPPHPHQLSRPSPARPFAKAAQGTGSQLDLEPVGPGANCI